MENEEMDAASGGNRDRGERKNADDAPILLNAKEAAALCMISESYFVGPEKPH